MSDRTLVVGIDEAGYGPILGPLVVSASAFEMPGELAETSLWRLLDESVSSRASSAGGRIAIVDSKKLHKPAEGIGRLERTALAAVAAWRGLPPTMSGLCRLVCPEAIGALREYAWYQDDDLALPREADAGGVRIASRLFARDLAGSGLAFAGLWSEVLPEGHFNRLCTSVQNKAIVLMGLTLRLVQRVADARPDQRILFFVDKQGGRDHYGPMLLRSFEHRRLRIIEESSDSSAYELTSDAAPWRIRFQQAGETAQLPVALASILSKYLRELFMAAFNEYWRRQVDGLRPTAGYYEDGLRFLREIEPHLGRLGVRRELLVRAR